MTELDKSKAEVYHSRYDNFRAGEPRKCGKVACIGAWFMDGAIARHGA